MWRRLILLAGLAALALSGSGCASTKTGTATASAEEEDVSTLPWNRPQRWEGAGMMGGFLPPQ